MKKILLIPALFLLIISCSKKEEIEFPESMIHGKNVLSIDKIMKDVDYSIGAIMEEKATLKLVLTNLSENLDPTQAKPTWFYGGAQGWTVSDYDTEKDEQTFTANNDGEVIASISFAAGAGAGKCKIEFYENSETVTQTKTLEW